MWDLTVSQSFDRYCSAKGDGCMRDTDHHIRHPRGHLGDRVSARWTSGCAQRDDQFGRAQNTELGWSDPTFCHWLVAKRPLGSLQPNQSDERSNVSLDRPRFERCSLFPSRRKDIPFLLVFFNNRGRGEELFTLYFILDFTNHFTGGAAPRLGKSIRYTLQRGPSRMQTGTMRGRERPHPLTHGASRFREVAPAP